MCLKIKHWKLQPGANELIDMNKNRYLHDSLVCIFGRLFFSKFLQKFQGTSIVFMHKGMTDTQLQHLEVTK